MVMLYRPPAYFLRFVLSVSVEFLAQSHQDSAMLSGLMKPLADQARRAFREK
jgi:hypothetical protein